MKYKTKKGRVSRIRYLLTGPLIYLPVIQLVVLDLTLEIYHHIGFRLCNLKLVNRSKFIKIDRHKLSYLGHLDKLNCAYCGYANGLFNYAVEIGARTEDYWCGIKHEKDGNFKEPKHQKKFLKFGDEKEFKEKYGN